MTREEIKSLREALGMSQEDLAAAVGVRGQTVWRWEAGRSKPSRLALVKLHEIAKIGTGGRSGDEPKGQGEGVR